MIKIFSDIEEIPQLEGQLKALNISFTFAGSDFNAETNLEENEFYLFHLSNLNSDLFKFVVSIPNIYSNNCFFVLTDNKKLLHDIITKIGFQNVFDYPEYKVKLELTLIENGLNDDKKKAGKEKIGKSFKNIIGNSSLVKKAKAAAEKAVLNPEVNVLIIGESGTGKRLLAQSIHQAIYGPTRPFVDIVCNSFSETLLEAELFGHEKNAFEGALVKKSGLFELAENGTIFFDGIHDIGPGLQVKLLNVLEKKSVRRIGSVQEIPINVRVIASSIKDLRNRISNSNFNEDLLYQLNSLTIELAPLRDRDDDILLLAQTFIKEFCKRYDKKTMMPDEHLKDALVNYNWPGNIRELRNAVERAVILSPSESLTTDQFEFSVQKPVSQLNKKGRYVSSDNINLDIPYKVTDLETISSLYAKEVLAKMNGSKIKTAQLLNISRPKLDKLLNQKAHKK